MQAKSARLVSILSIISILSIVSGSTAFAQPVALTVRPDRNRIYLGESFNLYVTVNGADDDRTLPDLSALSGADIAYLGSQSISRRMISNINGHVRREETRGRMFVFQIKPLREGLFRTDSVTLRNDGQTLSAASPPVTVIGVTAQSTVIGSLAASTTAALVDEPFRITFAIAIAPIPPPYHDIEPIHANNPPRLEADFLNIAEIKGLQQPDIRAFLESCAKAASGRQPTFLINNYADSFENPFRFRLDPVRENRGGTNFWVYAHEFTYGPLAEGDYTFGPMIFKGAVMTGVNPDQRARFEEIFAVAPAVTVRVTPPPETGRPAWFIGAVGSNLTAQAGFDTDVCKVGDPLTLTLDLTGAISLSNLRPPLLALQEDLIRDFRIYDDNVTTTAIESGKRFTWRVRPIRTGTIEFPPIRVAYYNTTVKRYETVSSRPIPIQARATTQVVSDALSSSSLFIRSDTAPVPAATTLSDDATPLLPSARLLLPLILSGPALLLLGITGRFLWRRRGGMRLASRRLRAATQARRRLTHAAEPGAAAAALRDYLTDRLQATGRSLTPPEASRLLVANGVPHPLADAFRSLLERLDEAIYSHGAAPASIVSEARNVLTGIETALAARREAGE
ncbi:MAG: protein BatD [Lentisphaerae bacterium]|nr:protein BatD [Lentisphaerota bacterium]